MKKNTETWREIGSVASLVEEEAEEFEPKDGMRFFQSQHLNLTRHHIREDYHFLWPIDAVHQAVDDVAAWWCCLDCLCSGMNSGSGWHGSQDLVGSLDRSGVEIGWQSS